MPKFLERKLRQEYGYNDRAVYGTMNSLGVMKGNKETAKGKAMQAKHDAKGKHPHSNLGKFLHPKRSK